MNAAMMLSARKTLNLLESKGPDNLTEEELSRAYMTMRSGGWTDKQLPDLLRAMAVWDSDHQAALGYIYESSKQGNPIEEEIKGGGGNGVVKDLTKMLGSVSVGRF